LSLPSGVSSGSRASKNRCRHRQIGKMAISKPTMGPKMLIKQRLCRKVVRAQYESGQSANSGRGHATAAQTWHVRECGSGINLDARTVVIGSVRLGSKAIGVVDTCAGTRVESCAFRVKQTLSQRPSRRLPGLAGEPKSRRSHTEDTISSIHDPWPFVFFFLPSHLPPFGTAYKRTGCRDILFQGND
jgi:hypothetical protein